jgi:hypothetical protein
LFLQFTRGRSEAEILAALDRWADVLQGLWHSRPGQEALMRLLSFLMAVSDVPQHRLVEVAAHIHESAEAMFVSTAEKLRREGFAEGKAEGQVEGSVGLLLRLLARRFGPLPEPVVARVKQGATADLELWADRVLTAATLYEVLAPA